MKRRQKKTDRKLLEAVIAAVAMEDGVSADDIKSGKRGVATASRQKTLYLLRTGYRQSARAIKSLIQISDPTITHSIKAVRRRCKADPSFKKAVGALKVSIDTDLGHGTPRKKTITARANKVRRRTRLVECPTTEIASPATGDEPTAPSSRAGYSYADAAEAVAKEMASGYNHLLLIQDRGITNMRAILAYVLCTGHHPVEAVRVIMDFRSHEEVLSAVGSAAILIEKDPHTLAAVKSIRASLGIGSS